MISITDHRLWEWWSGETAETFEQWITQAADPKHYEHAEEAIRNSWVEKWLKQSGDVLAIEHIRQAKSRHQLLDRIRGEGATPIDLPTNTHLEGFLSLGSDLYTTNVFRLTGLPVLAKAVDIRSHLEKISLQERLGMTDVQGAGPLPISPRPDLDSVRNAIQGLTKDPEQRILHEFFWFWPLSVSSSDHPPQPDPALRALSQGDIKTAVRHWERMESHRDEGAIARHNLAILYHTAALDLERSSTQQSLSVEQRKQRDGFWSQSFELWKQVIEDEIVWSWLVSRIRTLNDARLTIGYARRIREYLPAIISSVNGNLVVQAVEVGSSAEAERHLIRLIAQAYNSRILHHVLLRIMTRYRSRLTDCCKQADELKDRDSLQGLRAAETLLSQSTSLLKVIDAVTCSGSSAREAAHDYLATTVRSCVTVYENQTQRYTVTIPVLERALDHALGESVRKKIADEVASSRKALQEGDFWCGEGYFELPQSLLTLLEQARALANAAQHDEVLQILVNLLCGQSEPPILPEQEHLIQKPLAWCLSRRSVKRVNTIMEQRNTELKIIQDIRRGAAHASQGYLYSLQAAQQGSSRGLPYLDCMACGARIQENYYHFSYKFDDKELRVLVCPTCNTNSDKERATRHKTFQMAIRESALDIQLALELDDTNHAVKKNVADLKDIASSNDVPWPPSDELRFKLGLIRDVDLLQWFLSSDPSVRRQAAELAGKRLSKRSNTASPLLSSLLDMVGDPSRSVRDAAWAALNSLAADWSQTERARQKLDELLRLASGRNREAADSATRAVEKIEPGQANRLRALRRRSRIKKVAVFASVVIACTGMFLGYTFNKAKEGDLLSSIQLHSWHLLDETTTLTRIDEAAKSSNPTSRRRAIEAWRTLDDKRTVVVPQLILAQLDEDQSVASAASRAIEEMTTASGEKSLPEVKRAIPGLLKAATTGPVGVRGKALTLLGMIGPHENHPVIPTLIDSLRDTNKGVREAAVGALRQIGAGAKPAVPTLVQLLDHKDWDYRILLAETLADMGEDGIVGRPILKSMLAQLPPKSPYRSRLTNIIARLESAAPSLSKTVKAPEAKPPKPLIKVTEDEGVDSLTNETREASETALARAHSQTPGNSTSSNADALQYGDINAVEKPKKAQLKLPEVPLASDPRETREKAVDDRPLSSLTQDLDNELDEEVRKLAEKRKELQNIKASEEQWVSQLLRQRVLETMMYPYMAQIQGLVGTVVVKTVIGFDGTLISVSVLKSSNHPILDKDAVETIRRVMPLTMSQPVQSPELSIEVPVTYRLGSNQ